MFVKGRTLYLKAQTNELELFLQSSLLGHRERLHNHEGCFGLSARISQRYVAEIDCSHDLMSSGPDREPDVIPRKYPLLLHPLDG